MAELPPFTQHFQGFEKVGAVRAVFGERTEEVLRGLRIGFIPNSEMYMGIRDNDGNIAVGTYHLRDSPTRTLYLDIVHELFHINQRMTNGEWFHSEFMKFMQDRSLYYASPIEIPAYEHTVREAERIGMSREEIVEYLRIGDPPAKTWRAFLKQMRLREAQSTERVTRFPVKIIRKTSPKLYPFCDYFLGFEKAPPVLELFGGGAREVLARTKVEFIDSPFPTIYPHEEDGHLVVSRQYFTGGKVSAIYLDAILCLNMAKRVSERRTSKGESQDDFTRDPAFLESYEAMVREARRISMPDAEILDRLVFMRFMMSPKDYAGFLRKLGLAQKG